MPYFLSHAILSLKDKPELKKQLAAVQPLQHPAVSELQQLQQQGRELAITHRLAPRRNISMLSAELAGNEKVLLQIHALLNELTAQSSTDWQARELLQTSFNIIRDQVHKAKSLLIQVDSALPWVQDKSGAIPRVYDVARWMVTHTHARLEPGHMVALLLAYQEVTGLQVTELKAFRAMMKVALIDQLQRVSVCLITGRIDRQLHKGRPVKETLYAGADAYTADKVLQRNCISSLRILDTIDWEEFIDQVSIVEPVLCREHSGVYPVMDFYTRDNYRMEIGRIAVKARLDEIAVARWVVVAAHAHAQQGAHLNSSHIGYFLIGEGRRQLERSLGIHRRQGGWRQLLARLPLPIYTGSIAIVTIALLAFCIPFMAAGVAGIAWYMLVGLLLLPGAGHIAKLVIDAIMSAVTKPVLLPRFNFSAGIPENCSTLVAIPSMLSDVAAVEQLAHALEVRYLGNCDPHLYFSLVTDFMDAPRETLPQDAMLLEKVKACIAELNNKYCAGQPPRFFLFHRPRKWNPAEKVWMGYERKRGKLMELNRLLRGKGAHCFSYVSAGSDMPGHIKYVITLDSDTQLPRDTAWKMVATMAHPLNKAEYDERKKRVVAGYGMLQPRIGSDLRGSADSRYQRLHCAMPEIDPYIYAAPDLYQDLFGEGSFVGKGIYDVDVMISALDERLPENRILSHDMLEGCYARSGLLNDLTLFERPVGFWSDLNRRHRWTRGDWQIAAWAGPLVPSGKGGFTRNPLSGLARWKVLDNLRSSLLPGSLLLLWLLACTVLHLPLRCSLWILLVIYAPALIAMAGKIIEKPGKILSLKHWQYSFSENISRLQLSTYKLVCLPVDAWSVTDAVFRAVWRLLVSESKLLEWTPSDTFKEYNARTVTGAYYVLWPLPLAAVLLAVTLGVYNTGALAVAAPLLLVWGAAPAAIWWVNRVLDDEAAAMVSPAQQRFLRRLARKTWAYFDERVVAEHNWLPPDHLQEYPVAREAEYTSPTNMGLTLLANLTANDFGYITTGCLLEKTAPTLHVMATLERYKGHFYNWYDTRNLRPAPPCYVSTVDSGNLAGHLLTLRQGLLALPAHAAVNMAALCRGLADTGLLLRKAFADADLLTAEKVLSGIRMPQNPCMLPAYLEELTEMLSQTAGPDIERHEEVARWWQALDRQCRDAATEIRLLMPWLFLTPAPAGCSSLIPAAAVTLQQLADATPLLQVCREKLSAGSSIMERQWLHDLQAGILNAQKAARERIALIKQLAALADGLADMEYDFLYNKEEQLLAIGYQVDAGCQDTDCYDVLASEARLATFVAISQNKLPVRSWFALGRPLVKVNEDYTLLSANGTMFEYLMPMLIMPSFKGSLLNHACGSAVRQQINYGQSLGLPWGVSESCYGMMDANHHYQYKVFGIPDLGLKLDNKGNERVIAPYAAAMALMVAPQAACANLERLSAEGFEGQYGFYEAVDYTPVVLSGDNRQAVVRSFMAHHQGMSLLAYSYLLLQQPMQQRFLSDPRLESSLLLLQETVPTDTTFYLYEETGIATGETSFARTALPHTAENIATFLQPPATAPAAPEVQLLSNGRYHLALSTNGYGYSRWEDNLAGGWNDDGIATGMACYIRDLAAEQGIPVDWQAPGRTAFLPGCADCHTSGQNMEIHTRIIVAADEDMEIRQVTVHNLLDDLRVIEVYSVAESRLRPVWESGEDMAGQCTEVCSAQQAVLSYTKAGKPGQREPWMFHTIKAYNTNMRVTGLEAGDEDITAIRCRVALRPGEKIVFAVCRGIGENRDACLALLEKSRAPFLADHLLQQAWLHEMALLKQVNANPEELRLCRQMAAAVIYQAGSTAAYTMPPVKKAAVILRIASAAHIEAVAGMIQIHAYWRLKGLPVTLEIWNEDQGCYRHFLQRLIMEMITSGMGAEALNRHEGGIFIKNRELWPDPEIICPDNDACVIDAAAWNKWESPLKTAAEQAELLTI